METRTYGDRAKYHRDYAKTRKTVAFGPDDIKYIDRLVRTMKQDPMYKRQANRPNAIMRAVMAALEQHKEQA